MGNDTVVWLEEAGKEDISIVGGKGASFGEMLRAELPVPTGFGVTAQSFRRFIDENGISDELFNSLDVNVDEADILSEAEKRAKKLLMGAIIPGESRKIVYFKNSTKLFRKRYEISPGTKSSRLILSMMKVRTLFYGWVKL